MFLLRLDFICELFLVVEEKYWVTFWYQVYEICFADLHNMMYEENE